MSETMIERVARAMHRSWWEWADSHYHAGIPGDDACRQMSLRQARAAIEAMRDPTKAMILAGVHHDNMGDMEGRWIAMIDAALSQDAPSLPTPATTPTDSANPPPVESVGPNSEAQS